MDFSANFKSILYHRKNISPIRGVIFSRVFYKRRDTMEDRALVDWTEKYRPKNLNQVLGNPQAVQTMRRWARDWMEGIPSKRALILYGAPGIGKTSAALALAQEFGWRIIELNASDARNEENIQKVTSATLYESFSSEGALSSVREGHRTLIVFDEADNLYERKGGPKAGAESSSDFSDKGGKAEITRTIRKTHQPVILIANDYYGLTKNSSFKSLCLSIQFKAVNRQSMKKALAGICKNEGVAYETAALDWLINQAGGDLRGAINDLQSAARLGTTLTEELVSDLGLRDTKVSIFTALDRIFRAEDPLDARKASFQLDESPDHLLGWIDENVPREFTRPDELKQAMNMVSRADVFLGRVHRRQSYKLWSYAYELMTMGVNTAGRKPARRGFTRYQFPSYIRRMAGTKGERALKKSLTKKLIVHCHTSKSIVAEDIIPVLRRLLGAKLETIWKENTISDPQAFRELAGFFTQLELSDKEGAYLLGLPPKHGLIKKIFSLAKVEEKARLKGAKDPMGKRKPPATQGKKAKEDASAVTEDEKEKPGKKQLSLDAWG